MNTFSIIFCYTVNFYDQDTIGTLEKCPDYTSVLNKEIIVKY